MKDKRLEDDPSQIALEQLLKTTQDTVTREQAMLMEKLVHGHLPLKTMWTNEWMGAKGPTSVVHAALKEAGLLDNERFLDALTEVVGEAIANLIMYYFVVHDGESDTDFGRVHFYLNNTPVSDGLHERPLEWARTFQEVHGQFISTQQKAREQAWRDDTDELDDQAESGDSGEDEDEDRPA
jgi:hypothetical protein